MMLEDEKRLRVTREIEPPSPPADATESPSIIAARAGCKTRPSCPRVRWIRRKGRPAVHAAQMIVSLSVFGPEACQSSGTACVP